MFDIFKRRDDTTRERPQEPSTSTPLAHAPGTGIPYHPELMQEFAGHHASLRKLFAAITDSANRNDFSGTVATMEAFRRVLMTHLLEENLKLYTYLRKCLINDAASAQLVTGMKKEMGGIGTQVMDFLNAYIESGVTSANKEQFLASLAAIGTALADRLQREETSLYTLYMPPDAFA